MTGELSVIERWAMFGERVPNDHRECKGNRPRSQRSPRTAVRLQFYVNRHDNVAVSVNSPRRVRFPEGHRSTGPSVFFCRECWLQYDRYTAAIEILLSVSRSSSAGSCQFVVGRSAGSIDSLPPAHPPGFGDVAPLPGAPFSPGAHSKSESARLHRYAKR